MLLDLLRCDEPSGVACSLLAYAPQRRRSFPAAASPVHPHRATQLNGNPATRYGGCKKPRRRKQREIRPSRHASQSRSGIVHIGLNGWYSLLCDMASKTQRKREGRRATRVGGCAAGTFTAWCRGHRRKVVRAGSAGDGAKAPACMHAAAAARREALDGERRGEDEEGLIET